MSAQATTPEKSGPLAGLTVIEMAGLGPVPLAGLMLSEMGADVLRIERAGASRAFASFPPDRDLDRLGRSILSIDLKQPEGKELILRLAEKADVLIEGFRPGVMERLGLGPDAVQARNPALIYGRMTGFGQHGPLAARAGHDINYLAWSGLLHAIGPKDGKPALPLNLVGDYGGGAMFLIAGVLAALFQRSRSGKGQIIDAAMLDGASMLAAPIFALLASGLWQDRRGSNLFDSGAPFYDVYETADGKHVAVGCLEPQFFAEFARLLPLDPRFAEGQYKQSLWPDMRAAIAERLAAKTRDEWEALFAETDACVAPVLSLNEAKTHPCNRARETFTRSGPLERPAPAPRFSSTPSRPAVLRDGNAALPVTVLRSFGLEESQAEALVRSGVVSG